MRQFHAQPGVAPQFRPPTSPVSGGYQQRNPWAVQERRNQQIQEEATATETQRQFYRIVLENRGYTPAQIEGMLPPAPKYTSLHEYNALQRERGFDAMLQEALVGPSTSNDMQRACERMVKKREECDARYAKAKSHEDHYEILSEMAYEQIVRQQTQGSRDLSVGYDRISYHTMLQQQRNPMLFDDANADDLEIQLPENLGKSYQAQRHNFLTRVFGDRL